MKDHSAFMKYPAMNLCKEDITIEPSEDNVCQLGGDNCTTYFTHRVRIDLRACNEYAWAGPYCEECAREIRKAIQKSLPSYRVTEKIAQLHKKLTAKKSNHKQK